MSRICAPKIGLLGEFYFKMLYLSEFLSPREIKMYVREQMRNFQKVEKFLKLANFILKYGHFGNIARYIYFTYEAYGPRGGKQTKW